MRERTGELRAAGVTDQVLVCTNGRTEHAACGDADADAVLEAVVEWLRERDVLYSAVYVAETGCLGLCSDEGAAVVVQPRGRWFSHVSADEVPSLLADVFGPDATRLGDGVATPDRGVAPDGATASLETGTTGGSDRSSGD